MAKEVYTTYAQDTDITFIMEDVYDNNKNLVTTEVKGFYYGVPNEKDTKEFYGDLKAIF